MENTAWLHEEVIEDRLPSTLQNTAGQNVALWAQRALQRFGTSLSASTSRTRSTIVLVCTCIDMFISHTASEICWMISPDFLQPSQHCRFISVLFFFDSKVFHKFSWISLNFHEPYWSSPNFPAPSNYQSAAMLMVSFVALWRFLPLNRDPAVIPGVANPAMNLPGSRKEMQLEMCRFFEGKKKWHNQLSCVVLVVIYSTQNCKNKPM